MQNLFNFYKKKDLKKLIQKITKAILKHQKNRFKINYIWLTFKQISTEELQCFHALYNKHLMLQTTFLISNAQELVDF